MTVYIGISPIGVFAIENGKVRDKVLFSSPEIAADRTKAFADGDSFEEMDELILKFGDEKVDRSPDNEASRFLKQNMRKIAEEAGFKDIELNKYLAKFGVASSKTSIKTKERRDKLIAQAVSAYNDMNKILNLMSERLREWYGLHYPELRIRDHEKFAKKIAKCGNRRNMDDFTKSMGMELNEKDTETIQKYADNLKELYKMRTSLESYLDRTTKEEIPNLRALLGGILSARLVAHAGTLERLAKMPSSKIQLLGSEKSMFKFMKEKRRGRDVKPPKYGILFVHPAITSAPKERKGKVARLLAAKLTIAARMDFYSKEDHGDKLKAEFDAKLRGVLK